MISIEEAHDLLDEVAAELPEEFWQNLNGGVSLLPDVCRSQNAVADDLYTLGEYRIEPMLGRYINIYYGSMQRTYGSCPRSAMKDHLREVLFHEFTHHVESLAGERGLEIKDAKQMSAYYASHADDASGEDGDYDIRPAEERDTPEIFALYEILFREAAELQPTFFRPAAQNEGFFRAMLESETAEVLVAVDARSVLGLALVREEEAPPYNCMVPRRYAHLMDIVVVPDERGRGIGAELMSAVRDWARERGLQQLELSVLANNHGAISFYEHEGFAPSMHTMVFSL